MGSKITPDEVVDNPTQYPDFSIEHRGPSFNTFDGNNIAANTILRNYQAVSDGSEIQDNAHAMVFYNNTFEHTGEAVGIGLDVTDFTDLVLVGNIFQEFGSTLPVVRQNTPYTIPPTYAAYTQPTPQTPFRTLHLFVLPNQLTTASFKIRNVGREMFGFTLNESELPPWLTYQSGTESVGEDMTVPISLQVPANNGLTEGVHPTVIDVNAVNGSFSQLLKLTVYLHVGG